MSGQPQDIRNVSTAYRIYAHDEFCAIIIFEFRIECLYAHELHTHVKRLDLNSNALVPIVLCT